MIRLKELLALPTLYLCEANSGYVDHTLYSQISNKIYNGWLSLLESIQSKTIPLYQVSGEELDLAINKGINFPILVSQEEIQSQLSFDVLLAVKNTKHNTPIDGASSSYNSNPIEVYLIVNSQFSTDQILRYKDNIESLAYHETVHIIKEIQRIHQLSFKRDAFDAWNEKMWYRYHINSDEVHAYIAQINNELKQLKLKNKNISLSDALKLSKIWRRYTKDVFNKSPKLKNKMLSKIVNYWNKL